MYKRKNSKVLSVLSIENPKSLKHQTFSMCFDNDVKIFKEGEYIYLINDIMSEIYSAKCKSFLYFWSSILDCKNPNEYKNNDKRIKANMVKEKAGLKL